jgi:hypothetical protein
MPEELTGRVEGIVHEETQVHEGALDLTAGEMYSVSTPGRVDFGGGELAAAALTPVDTERRAPGDEYGWWHLDGGTYLLEYNETLTGGEPVRVQTRRALRERGAFHPTLITDELGRLPLSAPRGGVRIKANARVSTVMRPD